jgi:hypothetical protein
MNTERKRFRNEKPNVSQREGNRIEDMDTGDLVT